MSFVRPLRLPNVSNVGSNQTATIGMPVGNHTYESVNLKLTDIDKDKVTNIDILANGKPIQSYKSVADLEAISQFYGYHIESGEVEIPFYREHFTNSGQARMFNFGVADVSTAEVRFDIGAVSGSPAVQAMAPRYTHVGQQAAKANSLGAITKIRNFVHATSVGGRFEISDLPREAFLQALHLKSDKIAEVRLEIDGQVVFEMTKERMEAFMKRKGRSPQAGWFHLDWMTTNELGNQLSLEGKKDFRLIIEMSEAGSIILYPEYWSGFGGI